MVRALVFVLIKEFEGVPKVTDFEIIEEELPSIKNGEFLAEAEFISVDPFMKGRAMRNFKAGSTFTFGDQIAKIIESKNPRFPVGAHIRAPFGWRSHTISRGISDEFVLPDLGSLPLSLGIGILGMPGRTAYFGFLEMCQPKPGDVVVVSGAAGAVGNVVGQIAKIKGCKVIGIAGSDEKGEWLVDELGFDGFINYKTTTNFEQDLVELAPDGVDCYFDNVGGENSTIVLRQLRPFGRASLCGHIGDYCDEKNQKEIKIPIGAVGKQLKIEGFLVSRWNNKSLECFREMTRWLHTGKLKYRETVTKGFKNTPQAFIDMFNGANFGKAVVKV